MARSRSPKPRVTARAAPSVRDTISPPSAPSSPAGISPFVAKILDQLSITAWLPAGLLVANTAFLVGCFVEHSAHPELRGLRLLRSVLGALDSKPIGILIALLIGLSVTTLITQSLEFAAIRMLEGYWGGGWLSTLPCRLAIWYQWCRLRLLDRNIRIVESQAFCKVQQDVTDEFFGALPQATSASGSATPLTKEAIANAVSAVADRKSLEGFDQRIRNLRIEEYRQGAAWLDFAPASMRHRLGLLENKKNNEFPPDDSRMMPTSLGNRLRAFEDRLTGDIDGGRLRGYVIRNLNRISPWLLLEHDQYRNRLDMYSILTFVAAMLAILNGVAVWELFNALAAAVVSAFYIFIAFLSYRGALASASDYGVALQSINESINS